MSSKTLAALPIVREMVPGAVFSVADPHIALPASRADGVTRTEHDLRRVIVVQAIPFNKSTVPCTVLVVPCSASSVLASGDVEIPLGEDGFTKAAVAFTTLVQPILKSELVKFHGNISPEILGNIRSKLQGLLALSASPQFSFDATKSGVITK